MQDETLKTQNHVRKFHSLHGTDYSILSRLTSCGDDLKYQKQSQRITIYVYIQ